MEIGCRFGRDEEFDCKDKMKKSSMQKTTRGNPDIIGKLIFGEKVISWIDFPIALYQIWKYICGGNRKWETNHEK